MDEQQLIQGIKENSHCLWEAMMRFAHKTPNTDDSEYTTLCYHDLRELLTIYYELGSHLISPDEEWFADRVIEGYQDMYIRKIIKEN